MQNNNQSFQFTYSAEEQEEIKKIRNKYIEPQQTEDTATLIKKLDESAYKKPTTAALCVGVIGALVLGTGMSLTMTDIGTKIGLQSNVSMLVGVITGVIGIVAVSLTYPLYSRILKKERKKIAPEIIRLSDELIK